MAYSLPQNWYAIVHLDGQTFKIFVDRFDVTSGMDRCSTVKMEGVFDEEWKNEKETAPVMAAPKRKKPQRIRSIAPKRVKPKHKYPLLYKNSWNADWGQRGIENELVGKRGVEAFVPLNWHPPISDNERYVDLGNRDFINIKELQRAIDELCEKGNVTIHNTEIPANKNLADHLMVFTKNLKAAEKDALQKAADDVMERARNMRRVGYG